MVNCFSNTKLFKLYTSFTICHIRSHYKDIRSQYKDNTIYSSNPETQTSANVIAKVI